jgi:hypothetical protein
MQHGNIVGIFPPMISITRFREKAFAGKRTFIEIIFLENAIKVERNAATLCGYSDLLTAPRDCLMNNEMNIFLCKILTECNLRRKLDYVKRKRCSHITFYFNSFLRINQKPVQILFKDILVSIFILESGGRIRTCKLRALCTTSFTTWFVKLINLWQLKQYDGMGTHHIRRVSQMVYSDGNYLVIFFSPSM